MSWIQTFSGRKFFPLDPRPEDIAIEDIAHALSMLCRYGGHCLRFYSVAEHSIHLSRAVLPEHAMWALLHDASEAYLVDVPRPIKKNLLGYKQFEDRLSQVIADVFRLPWPTPLAVKTADTAILTDEWLVLMSKPPETWSTDCAPLGITMNFWTPAEAEMAFLARYYELCDKPGGE